MTQRERVRTRWSTVLGPLCLFAIVAVAIQGALYTVFGDLKSGLNDDWFYQAMSQFPFQSARPFQWWITQPGYTTLASPGIDAYAGQVSYYLSPVNGLANQPPFAFRLGGPLAVWLLSIIGMHNYLAFQCIWVLGATLFGFSSYAILRRAGGGVWSPVVVALAIVVALGLSRPDPQYPDALFLGLTAASVSALLARRHVAFAVLGFGASFTKESGVILALAWIVVWFLDRPRTRLGFWPIIGPIAGAILPRLLVDVPDGSFDPVQLFVSIVPWIWLPLLLTLVLLLVSPLLALTLRRQLHRISLDDRVLVVIGLLLALSTSAVAFSSERMPLFALPFLLCSSAWAAYGWRRRWTFLAVSALATYALSISLLTVFGRLWSVLSVIAVTCITLLSVAWLTASRDARKPAARFTAEATHGQGK